MPGRTPSQAVDTFADPLKRAVQFITPSPLVISPNGRIIRSDPHALAFQLGGPAEIKGKEPFLFTVEIKYHIVTVTTHPREYRVETCSYNYKLEDKEQQEIFAYHWHPIARNGKPSRVGHPHLHLKGGAIAPGSVLEKLHLPTGRIALEAVIRFLIEEIGITALGANWKNELDASERVFIEHRSWHS